MDGGIEYLDRHGESKAGWRAGAYDSRNKGYAGAAAIEGDRIGQAYSAFGMAQSRWAVSASGKLTIQQPNTRERAAKDALLSKEELNAFLRELKAAERAIAKTTEQLRRLGVKL